MQNNHPPLIPGRQASSCGCAFFFFLRKKAPVVVVSEIQPPQAKYELFRQLKTLPSWLINLAYPAHSRHSPREARRGRAATRGGIAPAAPRAKPTQHRARRSGLRGRVRSVCGKVTVDGFEIRSHHFETVEPLFVTRGITPKTHLFSRARVQIQGTLCMIGYISCPPCTQKGGTTMDTSVFWRKCNKQRRVFEPLGLWGAVPFYQYIFPTRWSCKESLIWLVNSLSMKVMRMATCRTILFVPLTARVALLLFGVAQSAQKNCVETNGFSNHRNAIGISFSFGALFG